MTPFEAGVVIGLVGGWCTGILALGVFVWWAHRQAQRRLANPVEMGI